MAADKTFATVAGRVLALEVGTGSMGITVTLHQQRQIREADERNGATVMSW